MNRRDFISAASITPALAVPGIHMQSADVFQDQQYYELRTYVQRVGPHKQRLDQFLKDAAIPAWNRHGIENVGVFSTLFGPNAPSLYVLLVHSSMESVGSLRAKLAGDEQYQSDAKDFLSSPLADPAYTRIESALFRAFSGMPILAVPQAAANNQQRIFELRIYESHSEPAAIRKVEMFNKGEIDIFLATGLTPVFFGEAIIGDKLPNLTYMLTFKDMADRDNSWSNFRAHPDWKAMSADPYYKDTVSNITSIILRPASYSQL